MRSRTFLEWHWEFWAASCVRVRVCFTNEDGKLKFWNGATGVYQSSYISGWGPAHTLLKNAEILKLIIILLCLHFSLTFVWNKAIVIFWVTAFLDQYVNLLALQLLTYFKNKMRKFPIFGFQETANWASFEKVRMFKLHQHVAMHKRKSQKMQIRHFIWWNESVPQECLGTFANLGNVKYWESASFDMQLKNLFKNIYQNLSKNIYQETGGCVPALPTSWFHSPFCHKASSTQWSPQRILCPWISSRLSRWGKTETKRHWYKKQIIWTKNMWLTL